MVTENNYLGLARSLRDRDGERWYLADQLQDKKQLFNRERDACRALLERQSDLEARLTARTAERDELWRQVEWLHHLMNEKKDQAHTLNEELCKVRRRLPGLESSWPRVGGVAAAVGAANTASAEIRRLLRDAPKPRGHSSCSDHIVGVCCSIVVLLPSMVWSLAFCAILDAVSAPSALAQNHWVFFFLTYALVFVLVAVQACCGTEASTRNNGANGSQSSDSASDGETARLLGSNSRPRQFENQGAIKRKIAQGLPHRWRHWQLPGALVALNHVLYLGIFAASYPGWCDLPQVRVREIDRMTDSSGNSTSVEDLSSEQGWEGVLGGGISCSVARDGLSDHELGRAWEADVVIWMAAVLPLLWALAWLGPVRTASAEAAAHFLVTADGIQRLAQQWVADVSKLSPADEIPRLPPLLAPAIMRRLRVRAAAVARSWRGLQRAVLALLVDAFDCLDAWQVVAINSELVRANAHRMQPEVNNTSSFPLSFNDTSINSTPAQINSIMQQSVVNFLLYSNRVTIQIETVQALRFVGLCIALGNLLWVAPALYIRELCACSGVASKGRRPGNLVTNSKNELFLLYMRGDLGVPPRNGWTAADAIRSIILVDGPLLVFRVILAYEASVGPSILLMKNIVCLCFHCCTLARYVSWCWRLSIFRKQHQDVANAIEGRSPEEVVCLAREHESAGNSDEMPLLRGALQEFVHLYTEDIGGAWDPLRPPTVSAEVGMNPTRGGLSDLLDARLLAAGGGDLEGLSEASDSDIYGAADASDSDNKSANGRESGSESE